MVGLRTFWDSRCSWLVSCGSSHLRELGDLIHIAIWEKGEREK